MAKATSSWTEAAIPGYDISTWFGVVAPAGTPGDIVTRLNATLVKIVGEKDMQTYLTAQGLEPATSTPEELARIICREIPKFAKNREGGRDQTGMSAPTYGAGRRHSPSTNRPS